MSVRKDEHGHWYFRCRVRFPDGKRKQISGWPGGAGPYRDLARTRVGAVEAERRAIAAVMTGKPLVVAAQEVKPEQTKTIREHAETFRTMYKPDSKPAAKRDREASLKSLLPHFGDLAPEDLKQTHVDAFVAAELERGAARKSINNRLACLSSLLRYVTGERPKLRLHIGAMPAEVRAVDPADVERLLGACTDRRFAVVILLAYEAGLRAGEIRGLQWTDLKDGQITVRRALDKETNEVLTPKHDKARTVPLSLRLTEALENLPRRGLWIVARDDGGAFGYWPMLDEVRAIYDRAGVAVPKSETGRAMPLHALRHAHGTVMARRVPLPVLQRLLGHSEIQTTMRYVDVSEADKREAIASVFGPCAVAVQSGESQSRK